MDFTSDLDRIIREQFDKHGIDYDKKTETRDLAASYLEMLNRRIYPSPRRVHFSEQLHDSLDLLRKETDTDQQKKAADAWSAVFRIQFLMVRGSNVNSFLSTQIKFATGKEKRDGMLWDFGMHHFHLSTESEESGFAKGFAKRSDYLLFAVVTEEDAYFVDVRRHPHYGETVGWARQGLLRIVQSNWPELIAPKILLGVKGDVLTDEQRAELRGKNVNVRYGLGWRCSGLPRWWNGHGRIEHLVSADGRHTHGRCRVS